MQNHGWDLNLLLGAEDGIAILGTVTYEVKSNVGSPDAKGFNSSVALDPVISLKTHISRYPVCRG